MERPFRQSIHRLTLVLVFMSAVSGCDWSPLRGEGDTQGYWLPLTVVLRFDPTVTGATMNYPDACGQTQTIPVGEQLTYLFRREIGMAFDHVRMDPASAKGPVDGEVEVTLGMKEIVLSISRQVDKDFPLTVTLGATVVFRNTAGETLYSKSIQTDVEGTADVNRKNCTVKGVAEAVNEAARTLGQGIKKQLGTSVKLHEYSSQRASQKR